MFDNYIFKQIALKEDERIVKIARTHWISKFLLWLLSFILISLPFFFLVPLFKQGSGGILAFFILVVAGFLFGFWTFLVWYLDLYIITTQRIIHLQQKGFFDKIVITIPRPKIRSVSYRKKGFLKTLFDYGDVQLEIAGKSRPYLLVNVLKPQFVSEFIEVINNEQGSVSSLNVVLPVSTIKNLLDDEIYQILYNIRKTIGEVKFNKLLKKLRNTTNEEDYEEENDDINSELEENE